MGGVIILIVSGAYIGILLVLLRTFGSGVSFEEYPTESEGLEA